jgi:hypothetical protein
LPLGVSHLQRLFVTVAAGPVTDIAFQVANRDWQALVAANALDLALRFLRANAAGDGRQAVVIKHTTGRFRQVTLGQQFDKAGG